MVAPADSWSQFGEDRRVWEFFGHATTGVFLEVGAHHPTHISQTYLLETKGWHGVLVEPQPALAALLRAHRPRSQVFEVAMVAPGGAAEAWLITPGGRADAAYLTLEAPGSADSQRVRTATIDWVLEQAGVGSVDYFSIDIEHGELEALRGFDLRKYRPKLIVMEDHLITLEKHRHLVRQGYRLVDRTGYNQWYVPAHSPFPLRPLTSRLELFRKMVLGLPFRKLKFRLKDRARSAVRGDRSPEETPRSRV